MEEGSPDEMGTPGPGIDMQGGNTNDDYEEIDYKICGELGKAITLL